MEGTEKHRAIDNGKQAFYDALRATILRGGNSMRRSSVVPRRHSPLFSAMINTNFFGDLFVVCWWLSSMVWTSQMYLLRTCAEVHIRPVDFVLRIKVSISSSPFLIYIHFLISPLNSLQFHGSVSAAQVVPRHSDTELSARI